ncbi:hypothetical protein V5799_001479 [Amblyomma americanum]|uniref:Uncharacterized protein n=1 Tax=Amblyomma americanum TaxID=6943 RepID=A0AAQ4D030_AMBAM
MGDSQKSGSAEFTDFLVRLESLRPAPRQPTPDADGLYDLNTRESELASRVRVEDCVVALATEELKRNLCIDVIQAAKPQRALILGECIYEDQLLLGSLQKSLAVPVHVLRSSCCWSWDGFEGVYLMEPEAFMDFLAEGLTWTSYVPVLILRDFQHYLDPWHPYRKIVLLFQDCRERKASTTMRLLAIVDKLEVCHLDALESELKKLRTPLSLTCCLGTPSRPHSKDVVVEIRPIGLRQRFTDEGEIGCTGKHCIQDIETTLLGRGIAATRHRADDMVFCSPQKDVRNFLSQFGRQLMEVKGKALLDCVEGRSLALVSTAASQRTLKDVIYAQESVAIIEKPDDDAPEAPTVLIATMRDVPTLAVYRWDAVLLCDLPFGVACDALFRNARRRIALATKFEWKTWLQALELHDDLEVLLKRVNE